MIDKDLLKKDFDEYLADPPARQRNLAARNAEAGQRDFAARNAGSALKQRICTNMTFPESTRPGGVKNCDSVIFCRKIPIFRDRTSGSGLYNSDMALYFDSCRKAPADPAAGNFGARREKKEKLEWVLPH